MILTSLELKNFGPYKGVHSFQIKPRSKFSPVIIVMGHNGAGKTTFLEALQLGLYGAFTWGLRNMSPRYQSIIKQRFNRKAYAENPEDEFSVSIGFLWKNGRNIDHYNIRRRWVINREGKLIESSTILKNDSELDEKEAFAFQEKFRSFLPPSLIEFFLFDGERIDYILRNADFSRLLRDGAINLFGLDIAASLQKDLRYIFKKKDHYSLLTAEEEKLSQINNKLDELQENYTIVLKNITDIEGEKEELLTQRDLLYQEFKLNGGLLFEEQRKLEFEIKELEHRRSKLNEEIKNACADLLPFRIIFPLLKDVIKKIEEEKRSREQAIAYKTIIQQGNAILADWNKKVGAEQGEVSTNFYKYLIYKLRENTEKPHLFDFSESDIRKIHNVYDRVMINSVAQYNEWFREINECTSRIQLIRKQLEVNARENSLEETWSSIQSIDSKILEVNTRLKVLQEKANSILQEIQRLTIEKDKILSKISEVKKDESVVNLAERLSALMLEYQQQSLEKQLTYLGKEIRNQFIKLLQKKDYINSIYIDSKHFNLIIKGKDDEVIPSHLLSAGERQLLLLSIIRAFQVVSGREIPLVLDTLMGRLDLQHRDAIIRVFLTSIDMQTIILATDSEFSREDISKLHPKITNIYHISYKENNGTTEVISEYPSVAYDL